MLQHRFLLHPLSHHLSGLLLLWFAVSYITLKDSGQLPGNMPELVLFSCVLNVSGVKLALYWIFCGIIFLALPLLVITHVLINMFSVFGLQVTEQENVEHQASCISIFTSL